MLQGQRLETIGENMKRAAFPATNVLMQNAQPNREQNRMNQGNSMNQMAPSNLLQFAPQN